MSFVSRFARALMGGALSVLLTASPVFAGSPKKDEAKTATTAKSQNTAKEKSKKDKSAKDKPAKSTAEEAPKAKSSKPHKSKSHKAEKSDKTSKSHGAQSIGAPNKGKLQGAIKLRTSRGLKVRDKAHSWGLPDLVKLLQRAATKVAKHHKKSVALVGDLSSKHGGDLAGHKSHQSGRDADVGFYIDNSKGKPVTMRRFVPFDGKGKSDTVKWAQFDDARNWAFVEALLTDKSTDVHYIFISSPLRTRLLAYAKSKKVDKDVLTKAAFALISPRDVDVHDDHFHVRISCPDSMKATCIEESVVGGPAPKVADDKNDDGADKKAKEAKASKKSPKTKAEAHADKAPKSPKAEAKKPTAEAANDVYSN